MLDWLDGLHGLSHLMLTIKLLSRCYNYASLMLKETEQLNNFSKIRRQVNQGIRTKHKLYLLP